VNAFLSGVLDGASFTSVWVVAENMSA